MVQPYQSAIEWNGEISLIFIENRLSHVVRRSSVLTGPADGADDRFTPAAGERIEPVRAEATWLRLAERVLEAIPYSDELRYARVDLVGGRSGIVHVMEVELTEPPAVSRPLAISHDAPGLRNCARARKGLTPLPTFVLPS